MMAILEEISTFLQNGRAPKVKELVQQAWTRESILLPF